MVTSTPWPLPQAWGKKLRQKFLSPTWKRVCYAYRIYPRRGQGQERRESTSSGSHRAASASAERWHVSQEARLSLVTRQPRCQPGCGASGRARPHMALPRHRPHSPDLLPGDDSETICSLSRGELCFACKQSHRRLFRLHI